MIDFVDVEEALVHIHQIPEDGRSAFKARLGNLKRVGAAPSSGGRGKRLAYSKEDVWTIAFALELAEFGADPMTVKTLMEAHKGRVLDYFTQAESDGRVQCFVYFNPALVSRPLGECEAADALRLVRVFPNDKAIPSPSFLEWTGRRAAFINITALQNDLAEALVGLTKGAAEAA